MALITTEEMSPPIILPRLFHRISITDCYLSFNIFICVIFYDYDIMTLVAYKMLPQKPETNQKNKDILFQDFFSYFILIYHRFILTEHTTQSR